MIRKIIIVVLMLVVAATVGAWALSFRLYFRAPAIWCGEVGAEPENFCPATSVRSGAEWSISLGSLQMNTTALRDFTTMDEGFVLPIRLESGIWLGCFSDDKNQMCMEIQRGNLSVQFERQFGRAMTPWDYGCDTRWLMLHGKLVTSSRGLKISLGVFRFHGNMILLAALIATIPAIALIRGPIRRYRRRKKGLCGTCGYDLTGNESGT